MAGERILLVDDDSDLCQEVAEALRENGYRVDCACDALQGRALIGKADFDVAFFDYKMTGLTGVDLVRAAKARHPEARVFIVSGRPFIEKLLLAEGVAHLVAGVIPKPFEESDLLAAIGDGRGRE